MKVYKKRLRLKKKYKTALLIIAIYIITAAATLFVSWNAERIDKLPDKTPKSVKIFGD